MGTRSAGISNSPNYRLDINTWLNGQNVGGNYSNIGWNLILVKLAGSGYMSNNANIWRADIDGQAYSGTFTYNFTQYSQLVLANTTKDIGHNADGTRGYNAFGYAEMSASRPGGGGAANPGGWETLPTIPRASSGGLTPTIHDVRPGQIQRIHTNRASTSFTHTIQYQFGNTGRVTIATGVGDWVDWNPPFSLLNQIPNDVTGVGTIFVTTYSGSSWIGETNFPFRVNVASDILPTFSDFTLTEANTAVAPAVGSVFVQNVSKLTYDILGFQGIYGSTLRSYELILGGVTHTGKTGTTGAITGSGQVSVIARVTDSRGRQFSRTKTISVLPYANPQVTRFDAIRSNSNGNPDPNGEYLLISVTALVTNLTVGGAQKNTISLKTRSRAVGDTAWTQPIPDINPAGAITYNSSYLISPYSESRAWDVRLDVSDKFNISTNQTTVSIAAVTMHWDENGGMGIGKFWQRGGLDVAGDIYHRNGSQVEPVGVVQDFAGKTAPPGWLICDGSFVSRTTYAALFAVIGVDFGAGNGTSTFALPDFRGRTSIGAGKGSASTSVERAVGANGGQETHRLTVSEMPSHNHNSSPGTEVPVYYRNNGTGNVGLAASGNNAIGKNESAGGDQPHNNMQPFLTVNKIIKAL